jgi:hypothetical protein
MPEYAGRVAYVDALTTDPLAAPVLDRYQTRYIPTSVFVSGAGDVVETYVGPLDEAQLQARLATIVE